ncbi:2-amino-4-hydroxy-6-hydroxymethyldihydropteridine diphosphokinase [Thiocystis violascens]|nr:2-amino-4-hydroxy-6-hydroxymethyldihydropteridine diphosphokinase [Thiocystis violascens]
MIQQAHAYIAVGSNIEPWRNIPCCLDRLRSLPDSRLVLESSWYRTSPWGIESQPEFINLVIGLETRLSPRQLLAETQAIETRLERLRILKNGPRTIDLDLLLFGDTILDDSNLKIPHPGLLLRDFMLIPLIEIAPEIIHPELGRPLSDLTQEIQYRQIVARVPSAKQT